MLEDVADAGLRGTAVRATQPDAACMGRPGTGILKPATGKLQYAVRPVSQHTWCCYWDKESRGRNWDSENIKLQ